MILVLLCVLLVRMGLLRRSVQRVPVQEGPQVVVSGYVPYTLVK